MKKLALMTSTALLASGLLVGAPAFAAGNNAGTNASAETSAGADMKGGTSMKTGTETTVDGATTGEATATGTTAATDEAGDANDLVVEATAVVRDMKRDADLARLLTQAKGIYIVPDYAKGGLIAGAHGGDGVVLMKNGDSWGAPVFYDMGAVSIGAQAGFQAGSVAMLLMDDAAVDSFKQQNNWSLDANADLTVVDYSAIAKASGGKGDIVMWSDTEGAFAGGDISVSDITFDKEETEAYYGKPLNAQDLLSGKVGVQQAQQTTITLQDALSG